MIKKELKSDMQLTNLVLVDCGFPRNAGGT